MLSWAGIPIQKPVTLLNIVCRKQKGKYLKSACISNSLSNVGCSNTACKDILT